MGKFGVLGSIAVAVLAFLLVVEAKILAETNDRILSGQRARVSQFPHQVSLRGFIRPDFAWHFCGGALINDRFVLTTANCMQGYNSTNVTINVGSLVVTQVGTMYAVSKITNHPQFNRKVMANDISVVKSAQRITFTNLVRPIRLPTSTVPDGYTATISGWGRFDVRTCFELFHRVHSIYFLFYFFNFFNRMWTPTITCRIVCYLKKRPYYHAHCALSVWAISAGESMRTLCVQAIRLDAVFVEEILAAHWSMIEF